MCLHGELEDLEDVKRGRQAERIGVHSASPLQAGHVHVSEDDSVKMTAVHNPC